MPTTPRVPRYSAHTSLAANALMDVLLAVRHGDQVTYQALSEAAGVDVQHARRDLLLTARRLLLERYDKVFDVILNVGLVCLTERGKVHAVERDLPRVHRAVRKQARVLGAVDAQALTPLERHRRLGLMSAVAMAAYVTAQPTISALEGQPLQQRIELNPADYRHVFEGV
jgi:hypothetical protein